MDCLIDEVEDDRLARMSATTIGRVHHVCRQAFRPLLRIAIMVKRSFKSVQKCENSCDTKPPSTCLKNGSIVILDWDDTLYHDHSNFVDPAELRNEFWKLRYNVI